MKALTNTYAHATRSLAILLCIILTFFAMQAFASGEKIGADNELLLMTGSLQEKYDAATKIYFTGEREVAAKKLESLLNDYKSAMAKDVAPKPMKEAWGYDLLITHGRLAKIYCGDYDQQKCEQHLEEAISLSKSTMTRQLSSRDELFTLVESVDKNSRNGR